MNRRTTAVVSSLKRPRQCYTKAIECIVAGDRVAAWDFASGKRVCRRVTRLYREPAARVVRVTYSLSGRVQELVASCEHPFWVPERGWVPASSLSNGDKLLPWSEERAHVLSITPQTTPIQVYNFEVSGVHNYLVGPGGITVHNRSRIDRSERVGIEYEITPKFLQHLLINLDLPAYERSTGINLRDATKKLTAAQRRGTKGEVLARALIESHAFDHRGFMSQEGELEVIMDSTPSPLVLSHRAPDLFKSIWERYDVKRDQGTLELSTAEHRPQFGFDTIIPSLHGLASLYPSSLGIGIGEIFPWTQVHYSRTGVQLEYAARAMNTYLGLDYVSRGIFGAIAGKYSYQSIEGKGLVRLYDYQPNGISSRVELRANAFQNPDVHIYRSTSFLRNPDLAYASVANSLISRKVFNSDKLAVQYIYNGPKRDVLIDEMNRLVQFRDSSRYVTPALQLLNNFDPVMSRALLGLPQASYSFPTPDLIGYSQHPRSP